MNKSIRNQLLTTSVIVAALAGPAYAGPVVDNSSITKAATLNTKTGVTTTGVTGATVNVLGNTTTINQTAAKIDVNWSDFSSAAGESIKFVQPNSSAIAINRVTSGKQSMLLGSLDANGRIVILNDAGVVFGAGSQTNVAALTASTAKTFTLNKNGTYTATDFSGNKVVVQGTINTPNGYVFLLAKEVDVPYGGSVNASKGTVDLEAGGLSYTVNLADDGKITYNTYKLDSGVINVGGTVSANSGDVIIKTQANDIANATMNLNGLVDVSNFQTTAANGKVTTSTTAGTLTATSDGDINVNGFISGGTGSLSLNSAHDINVNNFVGNSGTASLTSGHDVNFNNGSLDSGTITISAAQGNVTATSGVSTIESTGNTNITGDLYATNGAVLVGGAGKAFNITGSNANRAPATYNGSVISLTSNAASTLSNAVIGAGNVVIDENAAVTIKGALESYANNMDLKLAGNSTLNSNIHNMGGGNMMIHSSGNLTLGGTAAAPAIMDAGTGNLVLNSDNNASISNTSFTGNSVTVNADKVIAKATGTVTLGTNITSSAHSFNTSSDGNTTFTGKITSANSGNININSKGTLAVTSATVDAGTGNINFSAVGNAGITGSKLVGNTVSLKSQADAAVSKDDTLTSNNFNITAGGQAILPVAVTTNGGNLSVTSGKALNIGSIAANSGSVTLNSSGDIDLSNSVKGGDLTLNATGKINTGTSNVSLSSLGNATITGDIITTNGSITINSGKDLNIGKVDPKNQTLIEAGGATGSISLSSVGDTNINNANVISDNSSVSVKAGKDLNIGNAANLKSNSGLSLTSNGNTNISHATLIASNGTITGKAGQDLTLGDGTVTQSFIGNFSGTTALNSAGDANISNNFTYSGNTTVTAGKDVNLGNINGTATNIISDDSAEMHHLNSSAYQVGSTLTLSGNNVNVLGSGNVNLSSGIDTNLNGNLNIKNGAAFTVNSGRNISIAGKSSQAANYAPGTVTLNAYGDINIANLGLNVDNFTANIANSYGNLNLANSNITGLNNVTFNVAKGVNNVTGGDVNVSSKSVSVNGDILTNNGNLNINSTGDINIAGSNVEWAQNTSSGSVSLVAANNLNIGGSVVSGSINAQAKNVAISTVTTGGSNIYASTGDVNITADQNLNIGTTSSNLQTKITAMNGKVNLTTNHGDMNVISPQIAAKQGVFLNSGGDVSLLSSMLNTSAGVYNPDPSTFSYNLASDTQVNAAGNINIAGNGLTFGGNHFTANAGKQLNITTGTIYAYGNDDLSFKAAGDVNISNTSITPVDVSNWASKGYIQPIIGNNSVSITSTTGNINLNDFSNSTKAITFNAAKNITLDNVTNVSSGTNNIVATSGDGINHVAHYQGSGTNADGSIFNYNYYQLK